MKNEARATEPKIRAEYHPMVQPKLVGVTFEGILSDEILINGALYRRAAHQWPTAKPEEKRMEWRTIETAPKDGTRILLLGRRYGENFVDTGAWYQGVGMAPNFAHDDEDWAFYQDRWPYTWLGWMPLPPPLPTQKESRE